MLATRLRWTKSSIRKPYAWCHNIAEHRLYITGFCPQYRASYNKGTQRKCKSEKILLWCWYLLFRLIIGFGADLATLGPFLSLHGSDGVQQHARSAWPWPGDCRRGISSLGIYEYCCFYHERLHKHLYCTCNEVKAPESFATTVNIGRVSRVTRQSVKVFWIMVSLVCWNHTIDWAIFGSNFFLCEVHADWKA